MAILRVTDEEGVEVETIIGAATRRSGQQIDQTFFDSFCTRRTSIQERPSRRYLECLARVVAAVEEEEVAGAGEVVGEEDTTQPLSIMLE